MNHSGNTILITGGGSGIGRALAEMSAKNGNTVIITGRRKALLDEVSAANENITGIQLDMDDKNAIKEFADQIVRDYPELNVVINNAGIMKPESIISHDYLEAAEATITTNLLGPIRLIAALLPHLESKENAAIVTVSSGLAFVPLALTPTYNATKAAIHSYSISLREQLKDTSVEVIEIVPPGVQTDLMGGANNPNFMPLDDFISEVFDILKDPNVTEVYVENVKPLRYAEVNGSFDQVFTMLNASH